MSISSCFGNRLIATKLNIVLGLAIALVMGVAGIFFNNWLGQRLEERALADLQRTTTQAIDMADAYASVLENSTEALTAHFTASLGQATSVDNAQAVLSTGTTLPLLRIGGTTMNNNFAVVDTFTSTTGAVATVFVRKGDDFYRAVTSLKNQEGGRAIGTALGNQHPAHALLMSGKPYTGPATLFGRDYMTRYFPLKDATGTVVAVSFIGIDFTEGLKALKKKILGIKVGETGYVYAFDAAKDPGKAMIHPAIEGKNILESKDSNGHLFIREMVEKKSGIVRYDWVDPKHPGTSPRQKIATIGHFEKWGWIFGAGSYLDEFTQEARSAQIQFLIISLVIAFVLVIVMVISTRVWISRPLAEAVRATSRVAEGDLTADVAARSGDEVGSLLSATHKMNVQLRAMIGEINNGIVRLSSDAQKLSAAAHEVALGSGEQSSAAAAMAAAVEEMTGSINQVSQHAHSASNMAEISGQVSDSGVTVIGQAIHGMDNIAATVRGASEAVGELGNQSQQITHIVNVIREIADQTNLLALNAAIEAARAGEQGRGFAVVADEVRKLAERTTLSTKEIADMVNRIQAGSQQASESMEAGVRQVEDGVELANQAGDRIGEIKNSARQVEKAVCGISDALREQTAASEEIARNVEKIAEQAERNHDRAEQTSAAAESMEKLSAQLKASIDRFRV